MPSSNSSRQSADHSAPPTSSECAIEPAKPTSAPRKKIGLTAVKSGRWPVASQGSLVMTQSPGRQVSAGNRLRKALVVRGRIQENDAMPPVFSETELPSRSINTVAKSLDSRTIVENAVRSRPAAASSAMEIRRLQKISIVTGSNGSACALRWVAGMSMPPGLRMIIVLLDSAPLSVASMGQREKTVGDFNNTVQYIFDRIDMSRLGSCGGLYRGVSRANAEQSDCCHLSSHTMVMWSVDTGSESTSITADFFNTIGPERTCQNSSRMSACGGIVLQNYFHDQNEQY